MPHIDDTRTLVFIRERKDIEEAEAPKNAGCPDAVVRLFLSLKTRIVKALLSLIFVSSAAAGSWGKAAFSKWHETALERWPSDNVSFHTPVDRKDSENQSFWNSYPPKVESDRPSGV
ncbi:hypothetical protein CONLIGDRAFT_718680 [Coniochaeta ligniaria NRRL 30616]|uniref:Uncharacterized protein n=1 Tax=Coniochaeta ligniaria NRRL 30616 TaxID=1408157 RepID=A0A1J7J9L0_9PEZI|nr:hypothetical protein CONLIGDRAFT_718680 [Coniochaeta ligniaria NRRL 30616]